MKKNTYIYPLKRNSSARIIGNKASSLLYLKKNRFNIPETWIIPTFVWEEY